MAMKRFEASRPAAPPNAGNNRSQEQQNNTPDQAELLSADRKDLVGVLPGGQGRLEALGLNLRYPMLNTPAADSQDAAVC